MTDPRALADGLSEEERRELRRSAKRHWRWPWQGRWLTRIRLPLGSLERLRDAGLYTLNGDVNSITTLGRRVAKHLEQNNG